MGRKRAPFEMEEENDYTFELHRFTHEKWSEKAASVAIFDHNSLIVCASWKANEILMKFGFSCTFFLNQNR